MQQRNTVQRKEVLETVRRLADHPTAEEIYADLCRRGIRYGRATVYRNLGVLVRQGLLRHIAVPDAPDRYDHTLTAHEHLRCVRCGCLTDVFLTVRPRLDREAARQTGFVQVEHELLFRGLCPACQRLVVPTEPENAAFSE